jgi:hypothetical protein
MMKPENRTRVLHLALSIPGLGLLALAAAWIWTIDTARADTGGFSQVSRLEIAYVPAAQTVQARITLATGQALTFHSATDRDLRALFDLAQTFSQKNTRMFAEVQGGEIRSLQVSIP